MRIDSDKCSLIFFTRYEVSRNGYSGGVVKIIGSPPFCIIICSYHIASDIAEIELKNLLGLNSARARRSLSKIISSNFIIV